MPKPNRYAHVLRAVEATTSNSKAHKPYRVLQFGVGDGALAVDLLNEAIKKGRPQVEYWGFDLFEGMTVDQVKAEHLGVMPPSKDKVLKTLTTRTRAKIVLNPDIDAVPVVDLILIGGPRSLEAIRSGFLAAKKKMHGKTVVLIDNYYQGDHEKGSAHLVDTHVSALPGLDVQVRTPFDDEKGKKTTMVWVRPTEWPPPGDQGYVLPSDPATVLKEVLLANPLQGRKIEGGDAFTKRVEEAIAATEVIPFKVIVPAESPKGDAAKSADSTFPSEGGGDHPDVQPDGLRGGGGDVGTAEPPADPGDAGGRRESGVEPEAVGTVPSGAPGDPSVPEERPQPDPVVELGAGGGPAAGDPVRGPDELGREVPPLVVGGYGGGPQQGNRRSRRSGNQRPGSPPPAAGEGAG